MSDSQKAPAAADRSEGGLNRKELLARAAVTGAAVAATGSLAGKATAAPKRIAATPKKGGKLTFALEQDPVHIAPFGAILTSNHWGKEPMYESLIEWDAKLNQRPGARRELEGRRQPDDRLHAARRASSSTTARRSPPPTSCTRSKGWLAPPLPGSATTVNQVPSIESAEVRSKYVVRFKLKKPDARVFGFLAWARYSSIVPEGMYDQVSAGRQGIGTGPFRLSATSRGRASSTPRTAATGRRACRI